MAGVGPFAVHDRQHAGQIAAKGFGVHRLFPCEHLVDVAADGVDLAVVAMSRLGWARCQLGSVLVEKRECTMASADSYSGARKSSKKGAQLRRPGTSPCTRWSGWTASRHSWRGCSAQTRGAPHTAAGQTPGPGPPRRAFAQSHCQMVGMQARALLPSTLAATGTSRQPRKPRPSFCTMTSNIFMAWRRCSSPAGKRTCPRRTPARRAVRCQGLCRLWQNSGAGPGSRCRRRRRVLPSASLPARCSRFSTMVSASATTWWLLRPRRSATAPMPAVVVLPRGAVQGAGCFHGMFPSLLAISK